MPGPRLSAYALLPPHAGDVADGQLEHASILMLGRDLYYSMRCVGPSEALDKSRFALGVALAAQEPE